MGENTLNLPALRDSRTQMARAGDTSLGEGLLEFLDMFESEIGATVNTLREETQQALEAGDVSDRIRVVNTLKLQLRKVGSHLDSEVEECRQAGAGLAKTSGEALLSTVEKKIDEVFGKVRKELRTVAREFGL